MAQVTPASLAFLDLIKPVPEASVRGWVETRAGGVRGKVDERNLGSGWVTRWAVCPWVGRAAGTGGTKSARVPQSPPTTTLAASNEGYNILDIPMFQIT